MGGGASTAEGLTAGAGALDRPDSELGAAPSLPSDESWTGSNGKSSGEGASAYTAKVIEEILWNQLSINHADI